MKRILVAGAGSPLRSDDGLGVRLLHDLTPWIEERGGEARDIGTDSYSLVAQLEGWRRVIIIDAVDMGLAPGSVRVFGTESVPRPVAPMLSGHEFDLASAVALAEALHPDVRLEIVGIQPACVDEEGSFSPEIASQYHAIRSEVKRRLGEMITGLAEPVEAGFAGANRLSPVQEEMR